MRDSRPPDSGDLRTVATPIVLATIGESAHRGSSPGPTSPQDWVLVPEAIGIAVRVAVWSGVFCLLLIGLFTYPAAVMGAFVLIVLLTRLARHRRP